MTKQEQILEYTNFIHRRMTNLISTLLSEKNLSAMQMSILNLIEQSDSGLRISQLSRMLGVTDSNISAICQRMEKDGLVIRQRSKNDQRVVVVSSTTKAQELINSFRDELLQINKERMDKLTPTQQDQILSALKTIMELF